MKENAGINRRVFLTFTMMSVLLMTFVILPLESQAQKAKIYGKVAVIMKSGDVKPVAKRDFVLLPFSVNDIYQEAKVYAGPEPTLPHIRSTQESKKLDEWREKYSEWHAKTVAYYTNKITEELQKAKDQRKYIEFKTEFDGSYDVFVPPGAWYICSQGLRSGFFITIGKARIRWSVPITVKEGQVLKLDLENGNASEILNLD
jgi:hypothetical protein